MKWEYQLCCKHVNQMLLKDFIDDLQDKHPLICAIKIINCMDAKDAICTNKYIMLQSDGEVRCEEKVSNMLVTPTKIFMVVPAQIYGLH